MLLVAEIGSSERCLRFNHQPSSQYFGYQLGDGANNHNCDANGFSGWFSWSGAIQVSLPMAKLVTSSLRLTHRRITLRIVKTESLWSSTMWLSTSSATLHSSTSRRWTANDATAPTYVSGGDDITLDCAISDQWLLDNLAADEVVLF